MTDSEQEERTMARIDADAHVIEITLPQHERAFDLHRMTRRQALLRGGALAAGAALASWTVGATAQEMPQEAPPGRTAADALRLLMEGNERWASGVVARPHQSSERRAEVATGQEPFAIVFSCVDSRVPPELVFDAGLGDLLVIRTAGQAIDNAALGSIEYGVEELHIPLVVVLGHQRCGAVQATVEAVATGARPHGQISALIEAIRPAVEATAGSPGDPVDNAVRANAANAARKLQGAAPILDHGLADGSLTIVGAYYDLRTGKVEIIS
jgi:carbonic anhydrase